jgi:large subunit ribosomal protein L13
MEPTITATNPRGVHTINAAGKRLGRVASEAAKILIGKHLTDFTRNDAGTASVRIENASKIVLDEKKSIQKKHKRYSGYPGGLKEETFSSVAARRGYGELLRHAIKGMLPKNKLQALRMKRVSVTE